MKYALGNMLNGAGGLNADQLALDLQFAADKSLTARKGPTPTFTRASSGTFLGSNGLIQSAGNNVARFDHDPLTLASRGLLIEESRTNLTWPSIYTTSNLGIGVFPVGSATTSFNQLSIGTDPNGAALIREAATTQVHGVYVGVLRSITPGSIPITSGTIYTASIFVKNDGRTKCRFSFNTTSNIDGIFATFDIASNGSIITNSTTYGTGASAAGISATITKHIDGWFRLSVSGSLSNTNSYVTVETLDDAGNRSYLGDTSKGLFIANAQLEAGSFATSYIPTTTFNVVRSADVCSISGAGFTGMWNSLEGSLFTSAIFNAPVAYGTSQILVDVNDGTAANRLRYAKSLTTGVPNLANTSGNSLNVSINGATALQPFVNQKYSAGFKLDDYVLYTNNAQAGTDNLGAMIVSPTTMTIGDTSAGAARAPTNGTISAIRYYRKRLPNAKLQALTV